MSLVYACPDSVHWVKDADQVIVVNDQDGRTHALRGVEGAIWSWLSLSYSYPKLVRLVAALLALPANDAEQTLLDVLHGWHEAGLLCIQEQPTRQGGGT